MKNIIFYFFLSLLLACSNEKQKQIPQVLVNKSPESVFDAGKKFNSREIIVLETTPQSLLGHISKVIVRDQKLHIFDKNTNSVVTFDKSGKYLSAIRPSGRGPGEYFSLTDFTWDTKHDKMILLAQGPEKILVYDENGHFEYEMFYDQL